MKKISLGILVILAILCLSGCCLSHKWQEATCTSPRTCEKCGETEGEALGHIWQEATCTAAKTCETCGARQGSPLGHNWLNATCTSPKTCTVCGGTEGEALGHTWREATCIKPSTCAICGKTDGETSAHMLNSGGFCLVCDAQFGEKITKDTFKDYFEITYSSQTRSPLTVTVKPKSSGYTYGGGFLSNGSYGQPYIKVSIWGICTKFGRTDLIYDKSLTIYLDKSGYGSSEYSWSNIKGQSGYTANKISPGIGDVGIYCYPKQ